MFGISWFILILCFVVSFSSVLCWRLPSYYRYSARQKPVQHEATPLELARLMYACMSGILSWTFHMSDLTKAEKCLENHSGGDESNAHHPLEVGHPMSLSVFWKRAGRAPLLLFVGHIYLFIPPPVSSTKWGGLGSVLRLQNVEVMLADWWQLSRLFIL